MEHFYIVVFYGLVINQEKWTAVPGPKNTNGPKSFGLTAIQLFCANLTEKAQ